MLIRLLNSKPFFWILLALPAIPMTIALIGGASDDGRPVTEALLHPTGEFAARFMIIAMVITPLRLMFPTARWPMWLMRRRRNIGVAAFCYALAHTLLYIADMGTLKAILDEFLALGIWTGWAAFAIFIPLAITSNDAAQRYLASSWKALQRWIYLAAVPDACSLDFRAQQSWPRPGSFRAAGTARSLPHPKNRVGPQPVRRLRCAGDQLERNTPCPFKKYWPSRPCYQPS